MKFGAIACILVLSCSLRAQDKLHDKKKDAAVRNVMPVTVPAVIDHNRVIIEASLFRPDGQIERVHAWVDNGNPDFEMSRRLATVLGLKVSCDNNVCSAPPPREIAIAGLTIRLDGVKEAKIPLKSPYAAAVLAAGMNAEINLPSSLLRDYDILVDFPAHKFTIGAPGTIHFQGSGSKVQINPANGLIQVPSQIQNKKYNLALDLGSNISFLSAEVFDRLAASHADWAQMTGAVGPANMWGLADESKWKVMRLDRLQFGALFLTNTAVVEFPQDRMAFFAQRAGGPTVGLLGSQALLNYRVGLDYAHSMVYFDIGTLFNFPDFDVVGLTLRPEDDGRFTVLGVAAFDGQPSVSGVQEGDTLLAINDIPVRGSTMGQVWAMLRGTPGQERRLMIERAGKQIAVVAQVRHFLAEGTDENPGKKKK